MKQLPHNTITTVIPRRGINDEGKGKKYALYQLISSAETEYVHLLDDDVVPPSQLPDTTADMVILPLRMEAENPPTLVERLQIAEYAAIQELTIRTARQGHAVMCSGANLLVRRQRWVESYHDLHPEIASGDDMFLLESFKRRGLTIVVVDQHEYTAIVRPQPTLHALLRQRMRWAGKAPAYTDKDIRRCGSIVFLALLLQLICPLFIFLNFPIEYRLAHSRLQQWATLNAAHTKSKIRFLTILLLSFIYPLYAVICLLGGLLSPRRATY